MAGPEAPVADPELKEVVVEATRALTLLDAPRLEELAESCEALNRKLDTMDVEEKRELARQAREAAADMSVLKRVLQATRANRTVMRRLREMRERRLEYNERMLRGVADADAGAGNADGDD